MKNWYKKYNGKEGYTELVNKNNSPLKYIRFGMLRLKRGGCWKGSLKNEEALVTVLSGKAEITAGGETFITGERKNVFTGKPGSVYLSKNEVFSITALSDLEAAISAVPARNKYTTMPVPECKVGVRVAGKGLFTRDIYDILNNNEIKTDRIIAGETFHRPGQWSCIPPHKHDVNRLPRESKLEELYFFKMLPKDGFGFERLYTEGEKFDYTWTLKDNTLLCMPKGYHALAVCPGYRMYYLWILAGKERVLKQYMDPRYEWLNN
ncbi:MAG: 5-deoxy-glucuronate isomerase [Candidatus Firestonebacteria bacterium]